jgi:uncharacterized tellurite resistance protein B-like protein
MEAIYGLAASISLVDGQLHDNEKQILLDLANKTGISDSDGIHAVTDMVVQSAKDGKLLESVAIFAEVIDKNSDTSGKMFALQIITLISSSDNNNNKMEVAIIDTCKEIWGIN